MARTLALLVFSGLFCSVFSAGISNITLLTDNIPDYSSLDRLARSLTGTCATDEEKILAIWRWTAWNRHEVSNGTEKGVTFSDPVKVCASYTANHCVYTTKMTTGIAARLGYQVAEYSMACAHTIGEIYYGGRGRFIDADFGFYFRRKDDRGLASFKEVDSAFHAGGGDVPANPIWNEATAPYYSPYGTYSIPDVTGRMAYSLYFEGSNRNLYEEIRCIASYDTERKTSTCDTGATYYLNLRPFETYTRTWAQLGSTEDYYVPRAGANPNGGGMHLVGSGRWELSPSFASDQYKLCVKSETNTSRSASSPFIRPAATGGAASLVFQVDGGSVITSGRIMASAIRGSGSDLFTLSVSTNGGAGWSQVYSASATGVIKPDVKIAPAMVGQIYSYQVKVEMNAASAGSAGLDSLTIITYTQVNARALPNLTAGTNRVLFDMGQQPMGASFYPVEITFAWTENRASGALNRSHVEVAPDSGRHEYFINAMGPKTPAMQSLKMRLRGFGPDAAPGYSDGTDVGFGYERPRYFIDYGWDVALKKTYTTVPAPDLLPGAYLLSGRTAVLEQTGNQTSTFANAWSAGKNPVITVDLGSLRRAEAARMLQLVNITGTAGVRYADSVQAFTSTDNVSFAYQATAVEEDVWNPPVNYLWPSRYDMFSHDAKRYRGISMYQFPFVFKSPGDARYVQFRVFNANSPVYISKIQVHDSVKCRLVLNEFDHGFTLQAPPVGVERGAAAPLILDSGTRVFALSPFSRFALIRYSLLGTRKAALSVLDVRGRVVASVNPARSAGEWRWDASRSPAGLYVVRVVAEGKTAMTKMIKLK